MHRDEKLRPAPQLTPELLLRNGWTARHGISQVSLAQTRQMLFRPEEYRDRSGDLQPQGDTSRKISTAVPPTMRRAPRSTMPLLPTSITISMECQQILGRGDELGRPLDVGKIVSLPNAVGHTHARDQPWPTTSGLSICQPSRFMGASVRHLCYGR